MSGRAALILGALLLAFALGDRVGAGRGVASADPTMNLLGLMARGQMAAAGSRPSAVTTTTTAKEEISRP